MSHDEPDGDLRTSAAAGEAADDLAVASEAHVGLSGANPLSRFVSTPGYGASMTVLAEQQATEHIHGICLKTGPPRRVGVELEWLVRDARDPALPVTADRIAGAVAAFGAGTGKGTGTGNGNGAISRLPTSASPGVLPSGGLL